MLSLISYCYLGRVILSKVDYNLACNEDKFSHHCNPAGHQRQENKNSSFLKSGKIQDTKTLNLSHDIVLLQVLGWCFTFFTFQDRLVMQQKHLLWVEESRYEKKSTGYFEQQILASLVIFQQTHTLLRVFTSSILPP